MKSRFDGALSIVLRILCGLLPATLAAAGASDVAAAAHDVGVVRVVGAGGAGPLHGLGLLVAAPAMLLPFGTRALRAGLASALVVGIAGALAYDVARALAASVPAALARIRIGPAASGATSPRLLAAVSAVGVLTALLSPPWQCEAASPGGAVVGAALVVAALRLALATELAAAVRFPAIAFVLGLALGEEPLVFASAAVAALPAWAESPHRAGRSVQLRALGAFALGLLPIAVALAATGRPPEVALFAPGVELVERVASGAGPRAALAAEVGLPLALLGGLGAALALVDRATWWTVSALGGVVLVGVLGVAVFRAPAGPDAYAASTLLALLALHLLGVTLLAAVVVAIARARVPLAEASAAFVVVIELVLPVRAVDETASRREARFARGADVWNDLAWGDAPPAAVLLVPERATMRRLASTRATGAFRGDLLAVPAFDVQGRAGQHALAAEPKLAPLYRDIALGVPPEELSLAQLGAERPLLGAFDPTWDRALARHFVPLGLLSRFEPEPRGASDRRKGLDAFAAAKDRLVQITLAKKDAALAEATARLLRARAIGIAATGERDVLERALDELRVFSPNDPVDLKLVRRILTTKGPLDVHDLSEDPPRP